MKKISFFVCVGLLLALTLLVAPVAGEATQIAVNAGNSQSATAGTAVTTLPSVIVKDASDAVVSGVSVTFTVASGGGSVTVGTATTGDDGIATVGSWTLGTTAGSNTLTATSGSLTGSPVIFTATGTAGAATQIAANSATTQSATVSTAVTTPPSVIVKDVNNNPVSGASVTFAVVTGGGTGTDLSATTGSNGIATVGSWTLGSTAGSNTLTATSGSLIGSPVTFTATATASNPVITSISPSSATNSGSQTIVIVGTGFNGSTVTLTQTGQSTITGVVTGTDTPTTISRNFNLNGIASGTWNVVILNSDGGTVTGTLTVNSATTATITSISPISGLVNTSVSTTISGTGFVANSAIIRLYRSGNYIAGTVNSGGTTIQLTGSFNLNQATLGTYDVCVLPDGTETSKICSQSFTILSTTSTANGSIYVQSYPTSSKVFLNNVYQGYTPMTLYNITPGSPLLTVRRADYNDWSQNVAVTAGNTTSITASLVLAPEVTTATVTAPKTTVTTVKTTAKSTVKVPTPWPSATATPAPASPVGVLVILGAVGVGFIVIRKL